MRKLLIDICAKHGGLNDSMLADGIDSG